jgi:CRISPR-associated protein Cas2
MWLLTFFDLPTNTKEERRSMAEFRKFLQSEGLFRIQYSVYVRFCDNNRLAETILHHIQEAIPPKGEVRLVCVTDKQYGEMFIFEGRKKKHPESEPEQLTFF